MRSIGHASERSPGNVGSVFGRGTGSGNFYPTLTTEAQPGNGPSNIWADDPGESTALLAGVDHNQAGQPALLLENLSLTAPYGEKRTP
eukprot:2859416-Pyramimonas_sp.AAC.1